MTADCYDCTAAMSEPWRSYSLACQSCRARMLATGQAYLASEITHTIAGEYRASLETIGAADYMAAHRLVRQWRDRLDEIERAGNKAGSK